MNKLHCATLLSLVALATACSKNPEPSPTAVPDKAATPEKAAAPDKKAIAPASPAAPAGGQTAGGELAWDAPAGWETAPNASAMRKATYKIKRAAGDAEDAELSVIQAGGSVDANIERWAGQFTKKSGEPKRTELTVNDLKVTEVELGGTFSGSGMPGMAAAEPKDGYALLGAIVVTPAGTPWFFKMTGPAKTVATAKGDFDKLVKSLRVK